MRILSEQDVLELDLDPLKMADLLVRELKSPPKSLGLKSHVELPNGNYFQALPAVLSTQEIANVKWVSVQSTSPGTPRIQAVCLVTDGRTGTLKGTVAFSHLTALRTAVMSLVVLRLLPMEFERPSIGFIGTGVLARSHVNVLSQYFNHQIGDILSFNPNAYSSDEFGQYVKACRPTSAHIRCSSPEEVIRASDILVSTVPAGTVSSAHDLAWLRPGGYAALPDLGRGWRTESRLPQHTLITDDFRQSQELYRTGKMPFTEHFDWDLPSLIAETPSMDTSQSYFFAFGGLGIADALFAGFCLELAKQKNVGTVVHL